MTKMNSSRTFVTCLLAVLAFAHLANAAYYPIDINSVLNLRNRHAAFSGLADYETLGGVDFKMAPSSGNNLWTGDTGSGTRSVSFSPAAEDMPAYTTKVYTLMNTYWGRTSLSGRVTVEFEHTASVSFDLYGNNHLRDHNYNPTYTTVIQAPTVNVASGDSGGKFIDRQEFTLNREDRVKKITIYDFGAVSSSRIILAGMTVEGEVTWGPYYRDSSSDLCDYGFYGDGCQCNIIGNGVVTTDPAYLNTVGTSVSLDKLIISFSEPIQYQYWGHTVDALFYDNDGNEATSAQTNCYDKFTWSVVEPTDADQSDCSDRVWTGEAVLAEVVNGANGCPFLLEDGADVSKVTLNFAVRNRELVQTVEGDNDDVDGTPTSTVVEREVIHMIPFYLNFPKSINVDVTNVEAFSKVVVAKALVTQTHLTNGVPPTGYPAFLDVSIYTSVQHPFALVPSSTSGPADYVFGTVTENTSAGHECPDTDNVDCVRQFDVRITAPANKCDFTNAYSVILEVQCNPSLATECPLDPNDTQYVTVTFSLESGSHCALATDTITYEVEMDSYKESGFVNLEDNFLDQDIVYMRALVRSADVGIAHATLREASISGGSVSFTLFEGGSTTTSHGSELYLDVPTLTPGTATDPTDVNDKKAVPFSFTAVGSKLAVLTRSTETFTVTAVLDIQYSTSFAASGNVAAPARRLQRLVASSKKVKTLGEGTISKTTSSRLSIGARETEGSETSTAADFTSTSNLVLGGVCVVSFLALAVAVVAVRRARSAKMTGSDGDDVAVA